MAASSLHETTEGHEGGEVTPPVDGGDGGSPGSPPEVAFRFPEFPDGGSYLFLANTGFLTLRLAGMKIDETPYYEPDAYNLRQPIETNQIIGKKIATVGGVAVKNGSILDRDW